MPGRSGEPELDVRLMDCDASHAERARDVSLQAEIAQTSPPSECEKERGEQKPAHTDIALRHFETENQRDDSRARIAVECVSLSQAAVNVEQQRGQSCHRSPRLDVPRANLRITARRKID